MPYENTINNEKITIWTNNQIDTLRLSDLEKLYHFNEDQITNYEKGIQKAIEEGTSFSAAEQTHRDLLAFQTRILTIFNKDKPKETKVSYSTQSILSSSSVTKKESKLLVPIPKDYFTE